jgi:hypothetical protein
MVSGEPAVTVFAILGPGIRAQKPRQPVGRESSFSSNALDEIIAYYREKKGKK